jgi:predicted ArsR family transcriptional regulator
MQTENLDWLADEHARSGDPETSKDAARSMETVAPTICDRIIASMRERGPGTFTTIAARMGLPPAQVWKRLSDLKKAGLIESTGMTLMGPSGRRQTVWVAAPRQEEVSP